MLCPNGEGTYRVGEIIGGYFYREGPDRHFLRHCRSVNWLKKSIKRDIKKILKEIL